MYNSVEGIYITYDSVKKSEGVEKKVASQIKEMSRFFLTKRVIIGKKNDSFLKKVLSPLPGGSAQREYEKALEEIKSYGELKFVYIRRGVFDRANLHFLRKLRSILPKATIIVEFPTYPYDNELIHSKTMWPWLFKDKLTRKHLKDIVDRIVTYSEDEYIYGVPTIKTQNGIIVDDIPLRQDYTYSEEVKLLAVASMQLHHGYERIIRGMGNYKKCHETKVKLFLAGSGERIDYYKELTRSLHLEEDVIFYGNKTGKELDEIFDDADIGLGSFGFHLIGAERTISSTLKTREYLAHGLPFVSACVEDVFLDDSDCDFYLKFPDDDTDIDIEKIVDMYDQLKTKYSKNELRHRIHIYAKQKVDMSVVMKPVLDYIMDGSN